MERFDGKNPGFLGIKCDNIQVSPLLPTKVCTSITFNNRNRLSMLIKVASYKGFIDRESRWDKSALIVLEV
ncbi:MAG: hypothetical protein JSW00_14055 [Thermoplasmata archaeon]|nr:MAG: hypothetical protein JSW00_14055 [Thermoplasmata archaeon]